MIVLTVDVPDERIGGQRPDHTHNRYKTMNEASRALRTMQAVYGKVEWELFEERVIPYRCYACGFRS